MADSPSRSELRRLRRALDAMPKDARAVFDRHRYEDKDYCEIAAELGITITEVERSMAVAMVHLVSEADAPVSGAWQRIGAWLRAALRRVWRQ